MRIPRGGETIDVTVPTPSGDRVGLNQVARHAGGRLIATETDVNAATGARNRRLAQARPPLTAARAQAFRRDYPHRRTGSASRVGCAEYSNTAGSFTR